MHGGGGGGDLRAASNDPDKSLAVFVEEANLKVTRGLSITSEVNGGPCLEPGSPWLLSGGGGLGGAD